jgi:hypothetical protein
MIKNKKRKEELILFKKFNETNWKLFFTVQILICLMSSLFYLISNVDAVLDDNSHNNEIFQNYWLTRIFNARLFH